MALYLGKKKITPIKVVDLPDDLNKELTENEKLADEIQATVNGLKDISDETLNINENGEYDVKDYGKVVVSVGEQKFITLELPESFSNGARVYSFKIADTKYLISANNYGSGLWEYNTTTNTSKQLADGYQYISFVMLDNNRCLIASDASTGKGGYLLIYDLMTEELREIYNKPFGKLAVKAIASNKLLVTSSKTSGVFLLNTDTEDCTMIYSEGTNWTRFVEIEDKLLISNTGSSYKGILAFDLSTETITKIYDNGYGYTLNDLIDSGGIPILNSTASKICLRYYADTNEVVVISTSANYIMSNLMKNHLLLFSDSSSYKGILSLDINTNEIVTAYESGYGWTARTKVSDNRLLCAGYGSKGDVIIYDADTNTAEPMTNSSNYRTIHIKITDDIYLLGGVHGAITGFLIYQVSTNSFLDYSNIGGYGLTVMLNAGNGKYLFSNTVGTTSSFANSIFEFDLHTLTAKRFDNTYYSSYTYNYDILTPIDNDNVYIESSLPEVRAKYLYNNVNGTIKLAGYKAEV